MGIHRRPSHSPQIGLKNARLQPPTGTQDLIVIGLDEHTTNDDLRFTFRGLVLAQVKRHQESGHCKGYAFIRFNRLDEELRCLTQRSFKIRGRLCNVKRPDSQTSDLPPVRPPAAAPLPAAAASLPPAASIPPTEVGLIQPTKEVFFASCSSFSMLPLFVILFSLSLDFLVILCFKFLSCLTPM